MQSDQLPDIEHELQAAQAKLNLMENRLPDGDSGRTQVQQDIDGLWALFAEARKNPGNVHPQDFTDRFEKLHTEMGALVKRVEGRQ